mmetsp:Transcript_38256/g.108151  ORF Transcript_38256/g.108151 Transcript_38256/m.108151 type:complete len:318 (+) Transcript_38256:1252-2205(+)
MAAVSTGSRWTCSHSTELRSKAREANRRPPVGCSCCRRVQPSYGVVISDRPLGTLRSTSVSSSVGTEATASGLSGDSCHFTRSSVAATRAFARPLLAGNCQAVSSRWRLASSSCFSAAAVLAASVMSARCMFSSRCFAISVWKRPFPLARISSSIDRSSCMVLSKAIASRMPRPQIHFPAILRSSVTPQMPSSAGPRRRPISTLTREASMSAMSKPLCDSSRRVFMIFMWIVGPRDSSLSALMAMLSRPMVKRGCILSSSIGSMPLPRQIWVSFSVSSSLRRGAVSSPSSRSSSTRIASSSTSGSPSSPPSIQATTT